MRRISGECLSHFGIGPNRLMEPSSPESKPNDTVCTLFILYQIEWNAGKPRSRRIRSREVSLDTIVL